jgi:LacI family transcriptional regulator
VIGLVVHDLGNPYTAQVVQSIDEELSLAGYELILHTTHAHFQKEAVYVDMLTHGMTDGLLMLIPLGSTAYLEQLRSRRFPYVIIADYQAFDDFSPMVTNVNWQGAYDATCLLINHGHRRIGFLAGRADFRSARERLDAYEKALQKHDLPLQPELIQPGNYQYSGGYHGTLSLLDLDTPPTAILATNDTSALGAYDAARGRGLRIPDDLSVIGFDDIPQAAYVHPALTTVRQPLVEMGRQAAQLLLKYIEDPEQSVVRIILPAELVIRDSVCQAPSR